MRERTPLEIHELTGSGNVRRELKRRLNEEQSAEVKRYGVPSAPAEMDEEERAVWDALLIQFHDRLYREDAKRLLEIVKVEVLLARSFRAAKHGATFKGRPNPAHSHVEKYLRVRERLVNAITTRAPRPASSVNPVESLEAMLSQTEVSN